MSRASAADKKGLYYLSFSDGHREDLERAAEESARFSTALPMAEWGIRRKELFLLSLHNPRFFRTSAAEQVITCVAVGRRKRGPQVTRALSAEFHSFLPFEPLPLEELLSTLQGPQRAVVKPLDGGRGLWFPPLACQQAIAGLAKLRPSIADGLSDLWSLVNEVEPSVISRTVEHLAMQRDAIGLSLEIAGLSGIRRQTFRRTLFRGDKPTRSFIDIMDAQPLQERSLVEHDRTVFARHIAQGEYATQNFSEGHRNLRVWTVDKGPIEKRTGVDLVLYNRDYNSLFLIQYKCLNEDKTTLPTRWRYRPDGMFAQELKRMHAVQDWILENRKAAINLPEIRLTDDCLYFKFCKRLPLSQQDGELAEGMFVAMPLMDLFLGATDSDGPRGGKVIGYDNCERYLNNSLFCALARDGWIGTTGLTESQLLEILGIIDDGDSRSFVFAESRSNLPVGAPAAARRWRQ